MEFEPTPERRPQSEDLPELGPETLEAVRKLQGGETEESTRHLFEAFGPKLDGFFRSHRCQADDADELTQTVFIQMLEQIGSLKEAASFHFWLFRIARNLLRNFKRDRKRGRERDEELAGTARRDSEPGALWVRGTFEPSPEARLTVSETADQRRRTLSRLLQATRLATRTRRTLLLRFQGASYEEIAGELEIPSGTVGSHIRRASEALLRNLDRIGPAPEGAEELDDDLVAELSSELLTFKREALEADPSYFQAGHLESASVGDAVAEEAEEELTARFEEVRDHEAEAAEAEAEKLAVKAKKRVRDSPAAIAAVAKQERSRGRARRRGTQPIVPAGEREKEPVLGYLGKEDLGFPAVLLEEAATLSPGLDLDLALKAKLTCAGSLLARGRRFKVARRVEEIVRQAILLVDNAARDPQGLWAGNGHYANVRQKLGEGSSLLRSYLGHQQPVKRSLETCPQS